MSALPEHVTPLLKLAPNLGPYSVALERGDTDAAETAIVVREHNEAGTTALVMTQEQARRIGLELIRLANAAEFEDSEVAQVIELASLR